MTNKEINAAYIGSEQVDKIYLGEDLVYGGGEPGPEPDYLAFNITSPGDIVWSSKYYEYPVTISYSKNGGPWTDIASASGSSAPHIAVVANDVVRFRGNNQTYSGHYTEGSAQIPYTTTFGSSTCGAELSGNIMSMIDGSDFASSTTLVSSLTFSSFFDGFSGLTDASNLGLPATALTQSCYQSMFNGCTSLTTAPSLPATTLVSACYAGMFFGCTSLTTAPELPATSLATNCYVDMFNGCTSLTTAPELPATTLAQYCYRSMFAGCRSLNYIKCLATNISATNCLTNWVNGVAVSGTFYKNPDMSSWPTGTSGIPSGWIVLDKPTHNTGVWLRFSDGEGWQETIGTTSGNSYVWDLEGIEYSITNFYIISDGNYVHNIDYTRCGEREYNGVVCDSEGGFDDGEGVYATCANETGTTEMQTAFDAYYITYTPGATPVVSASTSGECACDEIGLCDDGEGNCTECGADCANDWESLGYESEQDCNCQEYGEDCPTDCNDWENLGYESYEDCTCQEQGEGCEEEPEE